MKPAPSNKALKGPDENKAQRSGGAAAPAGPVVERFPKRVGNKLVSDRPLTGAEARASDAERKVTREARALRSQRRRGA